MSDETPQPEGEPSPAAPEEAPTAGTKAFTYDDAIAQGRTGDEDDVAAAAAARTPRQPTQAARSPPRSPGAPVAPARRARPTGPQASSSRSGSGSSPPRSSPR